MKKLNIKSGNCTLEKDGYGVGINGVSLEKLVNNNLPELKNYKSYPIKLDLSIEFLGDDNLKIETEGYELSEEKTEEDGGNE
ncbi:hypothetical protein [Clostridium sp.]|jgi:hypothetical protein|uniref:hypothetical protein n=1 Tax=Clostridium sp. TaxID=1506 RepID=UPI003A1C690E